MKEMSGTRLAPASAERDFDADKAEVRRAVDAFLAHIFERQPDSEVARAARYAVGGPAHRWRAIAAVAAGRIYRDDALTLVLPSACGVELAHAASLVLDDLPSMDDAEVRRGKPCTHHTFPSWAVDMAPVFLVTLAYRISLDNPAVPADRRVKAALELSKAGLAMIEGQSHDVLQDRGGNGDEAAWLVECYRLKSSALYGASAMMGGILCGADDEEAARLYAAGVDLGLSYQFLDDVADVVAGIAEVGKESGMDEGKRTSVDLFGVEGARTRSRAFQDRALAHLEPFGQEADWLRTLVTEASWKAS
jgi:geranylgeranyl pyrophosphate synthase